MESHKNLHSGCAHGALWQESHQKKHQDSKQFAETTKPIKHQPSNTFQPATVEQYHSTFTLVDNTGQQNLTFFLSHELQ